MTEPTVEGGFEYNHRKLQSLGVKLGEVEIEK